MSFGGKVGAEVCEDWDGARDGVGTVEGLGGVGVWMGGKGGSASGDGRRARSPSWRALFETATAVKTIARVRTRRTRAVMTMVIAMVRAERGWGGGVGVVCFGFIQKAEEWRLKVKHVWDSEDDIKVGMGGSTCAWGRFGGIGGGKKLRGEA